MVELTKEQRQQIAIEEYRKQPFQSLSVPTLLHAGKVIVDTNADRLQVKADATINGQRYQVLAVYTVKKI